MPRLTTTQRGYGTAHQRARREALAQLRDGDPCARCGRPMYRTQRLDLDHADDRASYLGLSHANQCNRAAGARKGNQNRRTPPTPWNSRNW